VKELQLEPRTSIPDKIDITGGYCSDLLSDVLGHANAGDIWVTNQKHQNCIAVACLLELGAVVIAGGVEPDVDTVEKASTEGVPLFTTNDSAFNVVGRLYELGIRSKPRGG
jgi:predicted transcriptional regulator